MTESTHQRMATRPGTSTGLPFSLTQLAGAAAVAAAILEAYLYRDGLLHSPMSLQLLLIAGAGVVAIGGWLGRGSAPLLLGVCSPMALGTWMVLALVSQYGSWPPASFWGGLVLLTVAVTASAWQTGLPVPARLVEGPLEIAVVIAALAYALMDYLLLTRHLGFAFGHNSEWVGVMSAALGIVPLLWGVGLRHPARRWLLLGWVAVQGIEWVNLDRHVSQFRGDQWWLLLSVPLAILTVLVAIRPEGSGHEVGRSA